MNTDNKAHSGCPLESVNAEPIVISVLSLGGRSVMNSLSNQATDSDRVSVCERSSRFDTHHYSQNL